MKPWIGVTCDYDPTATWRGMNRPQPSFWLAREMAEMVTQMGGIPIFLPMWEAGPRPVQQFLSRVDGIIFSGGDDIPPAFYQDKLRSKKGIINEERFGYERHLMRAAFRQGLPLLAICAGFQLLNVSCGGTLYQDLREEVPGVGEHRQSISPRRVTHPILIEEHSKLFQWMGRSRCLVNSFHHQGIKRVGRGLRVVARSRDGVIEALERSGNKICLGVAWHPEYLYHREEERRMLKGFIHACSY